MRYKLTIEGMHCAACASNVERALKKIGLDASVSLMTKKAFVNGDAKEEDIKKAVEKAGYKVTNIEGI
jgi:copper chaperone CopZ